LSAFFLQIKGSIAFDKEKQVKSKMEINYQENKVQQKQELFDLETKRKIKDSNKPNLFV
jgi:polyisoprenoid-binding protein YceI